ncbi:MAG: esterase family protein [bacterium]
MNKEHRVWHSDRLGRTMGIAIYGHYGLPLLVFPTSGGDEWEYEGQGMIAALAPHIEGGRVKVFCINSVNNDSWYNTQAHPGQRSHLQALYDAYIAEEVAPFIDDHCRTPGIVITTSGSSFGAYHAANTVLKHPERFRRCLAMSGVYDLRRFMNGHYDDNFYFNNPVDYMVNLSDERALELLRQTDIHLITGTGPWEDSGPAYRLSEILHARGIRHSPDDWGPEGGHDWPYWKRQMNVYLGRMF